jgi:very-short-patch-repair endonuclease
VKWLIALVAFVVVAGLVAAALRRSKDGTREGKWPFFAKKPLSPPEQVLYFRLVRALPDQIVLAQVQLSRILGVKKGDNYQSWLNRISQLSADFVVCAKDASVLAVIELDDTSHQSERRREADGRKARALEAASLKLIRWNVAQLPDEANIRSTVLPAALSRSAAGEPPPESAATANTVPSE